MRLAAQTRGGFYPAPPQAITQAAARLRPPVDQPFSLLDPCAGAGGALRQLGDLLDCPPEMRFAIELDDCRASLLHGAVPQARVLAPASFFGCRATLNSFSMIWLNPPFDDGYSGHRVEDEFLRTATNWLMAGGVLALVCPENLIEEQWTLREHLVSNYTQCSVLPFPLQQRRFNEAVIFGIKRPRPQACRGIASWESVQAPPRFVYHIPSGTGPRIFQKVEPTEPELRRMLDRSPLRTHLTSPPVTILPAPPLALNLGHVALLLASGHLDGVVQPDGKPPHVVRGTSRKSAHVTEVSDTENDDGSVTTKTTISERIELVVRTIDLTGQIQTFMDGTATEA